MLFRSKSTLVLSTNSGGSFYGAGERGHKLNLRGDTLVNYNRQNYGYTGDDQRISQMNITMPVLLSSDGFALLFDDFAASTMVASDSIVYTTDWAGRSAPAACLWGLSAKPAAKSWPRPWKFWPSFSSRSICELRDFPAFVLSLWILNF